MGSAKEILAAVLAATLGAGTLLITNIHLPVLGVASQVHASKLPELAGFATCLKTKGILFYGAFWCPHCQLQRALFGDAANLLPYVECSNSDGRTRAAACVKKDIRLYPTWEFPDGTRITREMSLKELADLSGCKLEKP